MGSRDEPKLDELQRLLRRLEYMEVDKASDEAGPDSEPNVAGTAPGYVGALRGAPAIEAKDSFRSPQPEPEIAEASHSGDRPRAASTAPVVIGATTAAVVSSMIVVFLLLWTQDKQSSKEAEPQRLNFVAPAKPSGASLSRSQATQSADPVAQPDASPPAETQQLLQRADEYIRDGRLAEARAFLEEAAKRGSGVAALTLGAMYDPTRVAEFGNLGVQADPTLARAWYERARALGMVEANDRLAELARK